MKLDSNLRGYLAGTLFSNGLRVAVAGAADRGAGRRRNQRLEESASGKSVVHVGFADHPELVAAKRAAGTWLHDRLRMVSTRCVGIDANREAVEALRLLGVSDIAAIDLATSEDAPILLAQRFDLVIAADVIEHVDSPVDFARSLRERCRANRFLFTTPNATSWPAFRETLAGMECINSDHRYVFTAYTLAKVLARAGFRIESVEYCMDDGPGRRGLLRPVVERLFPAFREILVAEVTP